ncbi:hypothetical protein [Trinickia mobilis]|uniref:hypothetical protein n=1 Tax=Trinickia mobilis TaxID=2816356 RepID=UPI001A90C23F|nr:hypothetical protein [Trinickia mobilis]
MTTAKGPSRSPRGTLSDKPLYVGLTPAEHLAVKTLARQMNWGMSLAARALIVAGLQGTDIPKPEAAPDLNA